jgi:DNA-binding MarR family transcriptional regulator
MPRRPLAIDPIEEARRHWKEHGWQAAADGMAVITSVMRVQQLFQGQVDDVLRPFGLTFARYEALMLLTFSRSGSLPLGKIGERLQVHPASVTNVIDRLEADRLVRRRTDPGDARLTLATISARGRRLAERATIALNEQVFETVQPSKRDSIQLSNLLRKLRQAAGDFA